VLIRHAESTANPVIEIYLYRGRWQLATTDALYSDGNKYRPLLVAFKDMKQVLATVKQTLILGAGLGSAVSILNNMGFYPVITLVDIDTVVLQWALEFSDKNSPAKINPVSADAFEFVKNDKSSYDLLVIDIFLGRQVPEFVSSIEFLDLSKNRLRSGGALVLNYIINAEDEWRLMEKNFKQVFPYSKLINLGVNRVFIATV